ncbi:MAG: helix-turn-helix transcriptional regulator [Lachnospiraceae bacterium]|nr:helix-turn-helix transcriptional regulator [Lachnospiraceae bacterium]
MKKLETNDWIMLNSIIYKIYTMSDFDRMRHELIEDLSMLVNFDSADFYLASRDENRLLDDPVMYHCEEDMSQVYETLDYSMGIMLSGKSLIYRETDIMSDETRVNTDYYKKVYQPNQWHYSLQMIIAKENRFLGVITFYRVKGKDDFQYDDIFVLDILKDHLAYRLEQQTHMNNYVEEKLTISEAVLKYELTRREKTILQMLMSGRENADICEELVISNNTLKKHILNIYRKLGIKNRVQLFKMVKEWE